MAAVTERPTASNNLGVCSICHAQHLDALSPAAFLRDNRVGSDDGYWMVSIAVGRCEPCTASMSYYDRFVEGPVRIYGGLGAYYVDVCLTANQMAEATTAANVGAVTNAKENVHNGNIQLCNMRCNTVVGSVGEDTLYKQAMFEIWPYITALVASGGANRPTSVSSFFCCRGRDVMLKERRFVQVRKTKAQKELPPVESTADEQIFGRGNCDIPTVTFIADAAHEGVVTHDDVLAAKFCPTTTDRLFYANNPENIRKAVKGRITDKYVEFNMTDGEREELSDVTEALCKELRDSDALEKIASWLLFGNVTSKKWTLTRAEVALNCLMCRLDPEYEFKASIKLEPMGPGKPPRMLIADGDAGAVMSALTIGTLERYFCKYHKHRMIKGKPKAMRMNEICQDAFEMKGVAEAFEAFMMENDGSAWDACCRFILRVATENRIIDVVFDKLWKFFLPYNWYQGARKLADTKTKFKAQCSTSKVKIEKLTNGCKYTLDDLARAACRKFVSVRFDAIRRSGDRGTSILNFIINLVCWSWVLAGKDGAHMIGSNTKVITDIFKTRRRIKIWLEGDDSLLWLTGRKLTQCERDVLEKRWTQLGHRPKLFMRTEGDVAEFCGWKICVTKNGLDPTTAFPDVPRLLKNFGYTTAREAIDAAKNNQPLAFGRVVAPALIARAGSIAERVPTIARWLVRLSKDMSENLQLSNEHFSRDDMFRMGTEDMNELLPEWWCNDDPERLLSTKYESFIDNVQRNISNSVSCNGLVAESNLAIKHGWVKTSDEWFRFATALEAVGLGTPDAEFRSIVPPGMM